MQLPLHITFKGFSRSEAVELKVRERALKLERLFGRITSCRVVIEAPHQHHRKGKLFKVSIDLTVPEGEIIASRDAGQNHAHEDVYVAIRDAFDAAGRELQDCVRRRRGDVKRHEEPDVGRVVRLFPDDGYGFLESEAGLEVYFHENSVPGGRFRDLAPGVKVRFVLAEGESARGPQASTVEISGHQ